MFVHMSKFYHWFIPEIELFMPTPWLKWPLPINANILQINRPQMSYHGLLWKNIARKHAPFLWSFQEAEHYLHMVHTGKVAPHITKKCPKKHGKIEKHLRALKMTLRSGTNSYLWLFRWGIIVHLHLSRGQHTLKCTVNMYTALKTFKLVLFEDCSKTKIWNPFPIKSPNGLAREWNFWCWGND